MKKTIPHRAADIAHVRKPAKQMQTIQPDASVKKDTPGPPSEEVVARLNAIAREYPFCVLYRENNVSLL